MITESSVKSMGVICEKNNEKVILFTEKTLTKSQEVRENMA